MNAKTTTLTAALVLTLAGGLAACSSDTAETPAPTATATTEAPAPEPTEAQIGRAHV